MTIADDKLFYSTKEVAKIFNVTPTTIRMWDKNDILKPTFITTGGHRKYSRKQITELLEQYGDKK